MNTSALTIAKEIFSKMSPEDFCGCWEGDITNNYPEGVTEFLKKFETRLNQNEESGYQ